MMRSVRGVPILLAMSVGLAACSVAERVNPVNWCGGDKPGTAEKPQLGTDEPYPNLADVPGRPVRPPAVDRTKIAQSLVADRENAQYTEEVLRRAPEAPAPRPAAARPTPPATAAAPPASSSPPPVAAAAPRPAATPSPPPPA
ncbi:MAG: hypothetical protein HY060_14095, partial [Proteobacteria bacterium]|nr:hypothetical protein [Pseudomonadota bacterium]